MNTNTFLGIPSCPFDRAGAVLVPAPMERTVSYGTGTVAGPAAILNASLQLESFDEETEVDFVQADSVHVMDPVPDNGGEMAAYLQSLTELFQRLRGRFPVALGGEHTLTYGTALGATDMPEELTVVHVDAHADLADKLQGRTWSHGTVMRRLLEQGCRIVQIGIRSQSRAEYDLMRTDSRIKTFYAHEFPEKWGDALRHVEGLTGDVYFSFDVDGMDPSLIPSTGTPQPDGLTWKQAMELFRALFTKSKARVVAADLVEFVPSACPPGCDIVAAKLLQKMLAFHFLGTGGAGGAA